MPAFYGLIHRHLVHKYELIPKVVIATSELRAISEVITEVISPRINCRVIITDIGCPVMVLGMSILTIHVQGAVSERTAHP